MSITRTYTGADGDSHIEAFDLAARAELTTLVATKGVVFRRAEPGHFSDWHNVPRRQWVVTLSGEAELGFGDGSVFGAGQGHANLSGRFKREGAYHKRCRYSTACGRHHSSCGLTPTGL